MSTRSAFVTGASSGFGFALCGRLLAEGWRVVATADADGPWAEALPRAEIMACDVADPASVAQAAARAGDVDLLVNNAGYAVFGSQEEADLDAVRAMFEVNVFGLGRVTQALLPRLRAARGTVVQLSSIAGRTVFPESGWYAATKYAVEAMSEALFQETCRFGVKVRLVEPGSFATGFQARATAASRPRDPSGAYAALHPAWDARKTAVLEPPQDPQLVVDAIVRSLDDPAPFLRVPVGPDALRILGLRDALGADRWSRFAADRAGLEAPHAPGEVLSPAEVLAGAADLDATRAAMAHGHLGHWAESAEGRAALARLAAG
jgi:NADP-dependent 3-hydroxy acid dehydrogenase YdfG